MADIREIDYDEIIRKASNIASSADEMQRAIKDAFKEIEAMRENWFGQSYDHFIDTVNMSIISLNKLFETTVSDIPHEIVAKAKSYASANQSTTSVSFNEQLALILVDISKTDKGAKLRFKGSEVLANQNQIKAKFDNAKSCADSALKGCESLSTDWQSISGDTNIKELKQAFEKVKTILDNLFNSLDSQVTAQSATIEALESAANAVVSTQKVVDNAVDNVKDFASNAVSKIQQSASDLWTNLTGKN